MFLVKFRLKQIGLINNLRRLYEDTLEMQKDFREVYVLSRSSVHGYADLRSKEDRARDSPFDL